MIVKIIIIIINNKKNIHVLKSSFLKLKIRDIEIENIKYADIIL